MYKKNQYSRIPVLRVNSTADEIVKRLTVATRVSSLFQINTKSQYYPFAISAIRTTLLSFPTLANVQEVILHKAENKNNQFANTIYAIRFSKEKINQDEANYACDTNKYSDFNFDFDINHIETVLIGNQVTYSSPIIATRVDPIEFYRFRLSNPVYCFEKFVNYQELRFYFPNMFNLFPIILRGLFDFPIYEECTDLQGERRQVLVDDQWNPEYLSGISDENLNNLITIAMPEFLKSIGMSENVTEQMILLRDDAMKNLQRTKQRPSVDFI